ncbi:MAG: dicarboxylate/amino acid:cation symporter [Spirochaetaceae bacterium]|jgi:Na+/H+-dicarboxylate symporter|nr:dicarboxylate/amino acid:cation symporter [Spirochaetaceae bacterium]
MQNVLKSLPARLVIALALGLGAGLVAGPKAMQVIITVQSILYQMIMFTVPLIIIGFIAPSITRLGSAASRMLGLALLLAYLSSVCAALFASAAGFGIIPFLNISPPEGAERALPKLIFDLKIPQVMPVMSALVLSILIGLAAIWNKSRTVITLLEEFQHIVLSIVTAVIIPLLPFFIGCTFASLGYEGTITRELPVFLIVVLIVMAGHYIWLALLYLIAGIYSGQNPLHVLKHYGPAYLTAVGTMSSAATLPVALRCARKSGILREDITAFGVPLFANIHLCGSVLTETFFVMIVSKILYGALPEPGTLILFCLLLGIFAIGAPGVPGGTVFASLGLISSVLGFDSAGTALILTIFALQDSFGTACNVTGDGALTLILSSYADKHKLGRQ